MTFNEGELVCWSNRRKTRHTDSEISLTEKDDKSKEREESSNLYYTLKKSEVIEENGYSLQSKNTAEYVNVDQ
jgi:hypothetical protein